MTKADAVLTRLRRICLSLPDTQETITWGEPHFRVANKIFCGFGEEKGKLAIGFKLQMAHAEMIIDDRRFWRAPYVGQHGWVSMDASDVRDWKMVESLIHESYSLIAPKRILAKWDAGRSAATPAKKKVKPAAARAKKK